MMDHAVRRLLALAAAVAAVAAAPAAAAQGPAPGPPAPPGRWSAGLRAGLFEMVNSPDSYDAVFGDPMPSLGLQIERTWRRRLQVALSADYGLVEGERVLLTDPPRGTGIDVELTLVPVHLTAAWRFRPRARWDLYAGAGPSLLSWRDESLGQSASGSDVGGSAVVGLRRRVTAPGWELGGELRWSTFPGALPDGGVAGVFDEDDPGGVAATFLALRAF